MPKELGEGDRDKEFGLRGRLGEIYFLNLLTQFVLVCLVQKFGDTHPAIGV